MPGTADGGHQAGHKSHLGSSPHRAHSGVHGTRARGRALQRGRSPHRHGEPGSDGAGYTGWSRRNATEATPGRAELSTQLSTTPAAALGGRGRGPARHHADGRPSPRPPPASVAPSVNKTGRHLRLLQVTAGRIEGASSSLCRRLFWNRTGWREKAGLETVHAALPHVNPAVPRDLPR